LIIPYDSVPLVVQQYILGDFDLILSSRDIRFIVGVFHFNIRIIECWNRLRNLVAARQQVILNIFVSEQIINLLLGRSRTALSVALQPPSLEPRGQGRLGRRQELLRYLVWVQVRRQDVSGRDVLDGLVSLVAFPCLLWICGHQIETFDVQFFASWLTKLYLVSQVYFSKWLRFSCHSWPTFSWLYNYIDYSFRLLLDTIVPSKIILDLYSWSTLGLLVHLGKSCSWIWAS